MRGQGVYAQSAAGPRARSPRTARRGPAVHARARSPRHGKGQMPAVHARGPQMAKGQTQQMAKGQTQGQGVLA